MLDLKFIFVVYVKTNELVIQKGTLFKMLFPNKILKKMCGNEIQTLVSFLGPIHLLLHMQKK